MYKVYWPPIFWEQRPRLLYSRLLAWFTVYCLSKFRWVPFADLHVQQWLKQSSPIWVEDKQQSSRGNW